MKRRLHRHPARRHLTVIRAVLLSAIATAGCAKSLGDEAAPSKQAPKAAVVLQTLVADTLDIEQTFLGEVVAQSDAALKAEEPGRVRRVLVVEGERVARGQLLIELDDRLAVAELVRAQSDEKQAQLEEKHAALEAARFQELNREQVVSDLEATREVDEAERLTAQAKSARASSQVQAERVRRLRITAPFDGVVAARAVDPGDWLAAGQVALQLVGDQALHILVRVPEPTLAQLKSARSYALRSGKEDVPARLTGVVNALEPSTRTALLRLEAVSSPKWLRAGATVSVVIKLTKSGGVVVHRDALVRGVAGVRVVRAVEGHAVHVPVEVLDLSGDQALVAGELPLGAQVVTKGNERLRPDQALDTSTTFGQVAIPANAAGGGQAGAAPTAPAAPGSSPTASPNP